MRQVAASYILAGQPGVTLDSVAKALEAIVGYRLFTVLLHDTAAGQIRRAYSSMPTEYPVGGMKPITDSLWMQQVIHRGEPYVGHDRADIRSAFFDYELIWSLGCESVLNLPVRWNGSVIGTLNLLHRAHWYDGVDPMTILPLAQLAVPAIQLSHQG
jgi:transcriptional regulator with GAF, ATPase, and Fis domain